MTLRLDLLRHGKTGYSGRYVGGGLDVPLSGAGREQMTRLRPLFAGKQAPKIMASPMLRCSQSCEILFPGQVICYDEDLKEIHFGHWEGLTFQEIVKQDPDHVARWADWSPDFSFPGGEVIGDFVTRVHRAGVRIAESGPEELLLIAHGGVIRALLCYFLGLDPAQYLLFEVHKGCLSSLEIHSEGAVLTSFNRGV